MDVIKFNSLYWVYKFKKELENNYKKMFYPKIKEYNSLWEIYVENYFKLKEIGLIIPEETEYPLYIDYFIMDTGYKNHTQYYKDKYNEFCKEMEHTILIIDNYLKEKEVI